MTKIFITIALVLTTFSAHAWKQDFIIEWLDQSTATKFVVGYKVDNGRWVGKTVKGNSVDGAIMKQRFTANVNIGSIITPRAKAGAEYVNANGKKITQWSAFVTGQTYTISASDKPPMGTPSAPKILRIYVAPAIGNTIDSPGSQQRNRRSDRMPGPGGG